MPTYEYICDACEHEFEKFQSITAAAIKDCPSCRKKKVRRKISSGAGILFKGGGFYETDYRSKSYNDAAKKDADSAKPASAETKSESNKSDAAPAAKPAEAKPAAASEPKAAKSESKPKKGKPA